MKYQYADVAVNSDAKQRTGFAGLRVRLKQAMLILTLVVCAAIPHAFPASADDFEYAEKLAAGGHFDFAEEICNELTKTSSSPEMKIRAELSLARIKKIQAQRIRATEVELRNKVTKEAVDLLEKIIANNPTYSNLIDVKFEIAEILIEQGMWLSEVLKTVGEVDARKKLKDNIDKTYSRVALYLKEMIDEYTNRMNKAQGEEERDKLRNSLSTAAYLYGISFYHYGTSYDKSEEKFKTLLEEAIKNLRLFVAQYGDLIVSYEAADYCGLCYYELGRYGEAKNFSHIASYGLVKMIEESEEDGADKREDALMGTKDLIQKAMGHYAKAANANGEYALAIQSVDDLAKWFPKDDSPEMQLATLEKAWAYFKTGNSAAFDMVKKIAESDSPSARDARDIINRMVEEGDKNVSPDMLLTSVRNLFGRSKYPEAIRKIQILMYKLQNATDEEKAKYLPEALFIMGESFRWQPVPRFYEAIIAYEVVYSDIKFRGIKSAESWWGAEAARMAADAYALMGSKGGDENDKKKKNELVEFLIKTWPDSPQAKEVQHNYAKDMANEEKYAEAGEAYSKVPASSKFYVEDKFSSGYMFYLQAKINHTAYQKEGNGPNKDKLKEEASKYFTLAEQGFRGFIKYAAESANSPLVPEEDKKKIKKNNLLSHTCLGRLYTHDFINKAKEAYELVNDLEKKYNQPSEVADILQIRIEALVKMGRIEEGEVLIKDFTSVRAAPEVIAPLMQLMAMSYEEFADKVIPPLSANQQEEMLKQIAALKEKNKNKYEEFKGLLTKAGEYYYKWTEKSAKISPEEALTVADKLYQYAGKIDKADFYTKAAKVYERIVQEEFGKPSQSIIAIALKQARCYTRTKEWSKALPLLEGLDKSNPDNLTIKKELAITYTEMGNATKDATHWNNAKKMWAWILPRVEKHQEEWWNGRYQMVLIDFTSGKFKEADEGIRNLENTVNKDFDGDKWGFKTKFADLKKKIKEIMPGK